MPSWSCLDMDASSKSSGEMEFVYTLNEHKYKKGDWDKHKCENW